MSGHVNVELPPLPECPSSDTLHRYETQILEEWACNYAELAVLAERERIRLLVLDDAWALTFQTFGQYRTALATAIRKG